MKLTFDLPRGVEIDIDGDTLLIDLVHAARTLGLALRPSLNGYELRVPRAHSMQLQSIAGAHCAQLAERAFFKNRFAPLPHRSCRIVNPAFLVAANQ
jgi:hypothetical protein